jgi:FMN phosphatase YigB (HAD superfamily)
VRKPKAVVFDLGNVLLDFDYRRTVKRIQERCKISPDELFGLLGNSEVFQQFEGGVIQPNEFFNEVQRVACYDGSFEEFAEFFGDVFTESPQMIQWHADLMRRGVPTYILSNTNDLSIRFIRKRFPFFANFTDYVLSYEHRVMKPSTRIYEILEERAGLRGPDLFYVDDREENIRAAAARGWQAVHHLQPQVTLDIARSVGL